MANLVILHNGKVKMQRNRFGGDTSKFLQRDHHERNEGKLRRRNLLDKLRLEDEMLTAFDGASAIGTDNIHPVRQALRHMGENKPVYNVGDILIGARVIKKGRRQDGIISIKLTEGRRDHHHRRTPVGHLVLGEDGKIAAFHMS